MGLRALFGADGVNLTPHVGEDEAGPAWAMNMRPTAYGFANAMQPVGELTADLPMRAQGNRIEMAWDANLTEWWVNRSEGLEQGFIIAQAPPVGNGPLMVAMALTTELTPELADDGQALTLRDGDGRVALHYAKLVVVDATGRQLPAWMTLDTEQGDNARLGLEVDAAGAVYPLTIDPLVTSQVVKLVADDGAEYDEFGKSVSLDGDTIVVGASRADVGGNSIQGAAYVFARSEGGADSWGQVAKLVSDDGAEYDEFGYSVSLDGDTIVVGARLVDVGDNANQGAAYVFARTAGGADGWGQVAKLVSDDGVGGDEFGKSVSVDGDTIVVGADLADVGGNSNQGAAYIFARSEGGADSWGQVAELFADDAAGGFRFGYSVSLDGDTIVVGATGADVASNAFPGAAYVFARSDDGADSWGQVAKLFADDGVGGGQFGFSVSVDGDTIVVGARYADVEVNAFPGAAFVFGRTKDGADSWGQVAKLFADDGVGGGLFGSSVSVDGDTIVVGAYLADVGGKEDQGAAYVYARTKGGSDSWGQVAKLVADDEERRDFFGYSVSVDGDTIVVGASRSTVGGNEDQGEAYFFKLAWGTLEVVTDVDPDDPATNWEIEANGRTTFTDTLTGDDSTGAAEVLSGSYTITETAGLNTNLGYYDTSFACTIDGAAGPAGDGTTINVDVGYEESVICTFTNTKTRTLTVTKALDPVTDIGLFVMAADSNMGVEAGQGAYVTATVDVGANAFFTETAGTGTDLLNYTTTYLCDDAGGTNGSATSGSLTMPDADVTCTFTNVRRTAVLTVTPAGAGSGSVTSSPAGIDCGATCEADFPQGETVTLTPAAAGDSTFAGWSGDADCADGVVEMAAATACIATFDLSEFTLTVNKVLVPATDDGLFVMDADGTIGTEAGDGATASVTVTAGQVATFAERAGAGTDLADYATEYSCDDPSTTSGTATSGSLSMPSADVTCTFTNTRQLDTVESATGVGPVTYVVDNCAIDTFEALAESSLPSVGKPSVDFVYGFFGLKLVSCPVGGTANVTIELPNPLPVGSELWKYQGGWFQYPFGSDDGDNVITIALTDGAVGDADGVANGEIVDPAGPGTFIGGDNRIFLPIVTK